jgi:hypothetical protein
LRCWCDLRRRRQVLKVRTLSREVVKVMREGAMVEVAMAVEVKVVVKVVEVMVAAAIAVAMVGVWWRR